MIPRILHHIWLGPRPVPDAWAGAWAAMHPGWEQRIWREDDLEALDMTLRKQYERKVNEGCWPGAADIARLEILKAHGGVYVDIDSRPLRTFEGADFMDADVFAAYEPVASLPGRVANGTIGAVAGADAIDTCIWLIGRMRTLEPAWDTTGGTALTAAMLVHRRCCDVRVLPSRTFYAKDASGRMVPGQEQPFCEHFWSSTNGSYPARAVVLVPRRAGDPVRDRAWEYVKAWWQRDGWTVVEGHHDDGPFNASAARNAAAAAANDWDVAVFADGDTVPASGAVIREAVRLAHERGILVRPFRNYWQLDEAASAEFMATGTVPATGAKRLGETAFGGVNVVSRGLFERVHGYDERFRGWGWEDTAFDATCRVFGGFKRLEGDVYHLWHPISEHRAPDDPQRVANVVLGKRYVAAKNRRKMQALIDERVAAGPVEPTFGLVIITNGRREWIERTVASLEKHVGPFDARLICDDSGDSGYGDWLRQTFPDFTIDAHRHMGHGRAVRHALGAAVRLPVEWVFFCEDDMEFERDVDLRAIANVLRDRPHISQMVIKRQAWFVPELEAGPTVIDRFDPASFTDHDDGNGHAWLEHRLFYSLNPHLVRRTFLRRHHWQGIPNSEHHFSRRLFRDKALAAGMWGKRTDGPWVQHIGLERTGTGY